ncbi:hypothetical protein [Microbacterium sp. C7(2022)]|uniref:hypothetical protein n=1 Tax=Microbacterium sp. C7(2022) TaxID=2992759 RepID=UPI00237C184E|nr:hypothetical protein [Microbacterium sp. C7(2022)]MDE0545802.1 hypothetical protein [Microbacterium sp. C7(2022)]
MTDGDARPPAHSTEPGNPPAPGNTWAPPGHRPFTPASSGPRYAPPAGYAGPAGIAAPTVLPASPPPTPATQGSPRRHTGAIALTLALVAAVLMPLIVSVAAFEIGRGTMNYSSLTAATFDWSTLTPVRDWVLLGEIAFWVGTLCGVWAVVQGIVATVKRTGRGMGVAAIIVAANGPVIFVVAVQIGIVIGAAVGIAAL